MKLLRMPQDVRDRDLTDEYVLLREIAPDEFLRLASRSSLGSAQPFRPELIPTWPNWFWLAADPETATVMSHEGVHRMEALYLSEYDLVEIEVWLTPDPVRFDGRLEEMLRWRWDGGIPEWGDLRTEEEWIDAIGRRMGVEAWRVYAEKARRAMVGAVVRSLVGW